MKNRDGFPMLYVYVRNISFGTPVVPQAGESFRAAARRVLNAVQERWGKAQGYSF